MPAASPSPSRPGLLRRLATEPSWSTAWSQLLVVLGLAGFALSQPLLGLLSEEPTWFTFRGAETAGVLVAFSLLVALVPPLVVWALGRVLRRIWRPLGWWYHLAAVAVLAALALLLLVKQLGLTAAALQVAAAVVVAAALTVAYATVPAVALWVRYTAILPALAVGSFLFLAPTSDLVVADGGRGSAAASGAGADAPSVFLLVLDELPTQSLLDGNGRIDAVRFPNLAELAGGSTWYRNYTSSSQGTLLALPSILSGKAPKEGPPTTRNHPDTIFSLLAPSHEMFVSETPTLLCERETCPPIDPSEVPESTTVLGDLLADGAAVWRDRVRPGEAAEAELDDFVQELEVASGSAGPDEAATEEQPGFASSAADRDAIENRPSVHAEFLTSLRRRREPAFWFLHLLLPHQPWVLHPDGTSYHPGSFPPDNQNTAGPWVASVYEQRHLLQLQYTDALVGQLLDALKESGEYDDALVMVTADHGVSFVEGTPRRSPVEESLDRLAFVPLFVKEPGQTEGAVDDSNVFDGDLVPTIADRVGVEVPWDVEGHPIGSPEQRARDTTKEFYDFGTGFAARFQGTYTFDAVDRAPDAGKRWIPPVGEGDDPIAGLLSTLEVDDLLGRSLDDVASPRGGAPAVEVEGLADLRDPPASGPVPGFVNGSLPGHEAADDDVVLVEVDDEVVSASPLWGVDEQGRPRFSALLPPGTLDGGEHVIRLALRRGRSVQVLDPG